VTNKQLEALNVKIAKKMGWKKFRLERTPEPMNTRRMTAISPGNFRHQFVPGFTNNLAYAMQLVDWAVEHEFKFTLNRKKEYEGAYYAEFSGFLMDECGEYATLPSMAICMAFLKIK